MQKGERYNFPLTAALAGGHHEVIKAHKEIVSYADGKSEDFKGRPSSEMYDYAVSWLLSNGFKGFLRKKDKSLHNANSLCTSPCGSNDLTHIKSLLSQNFICKDKGIISKLLCRAVVDKHEGIVEHLLGLGADPNIDYAPPGYIYKSTLKAACMQCSKLADPADLVSGTRVDLQHFSIVWASSTPFVSIVTGGLSSSYLAMGHTSVMNLCYTWLPRVIVQFLFAHSVDANL